MYGNIKDREQLKSDERIRSRILRLYKITWIFQEDRVMGEIQFSGYFELVRIIFFVIRCHEYIDY